MPNSPRGHIREFDGLRGIAILAVMVHHFWPRSGPLAEYSALPHLGWVGVDLFFVLSGCLICGILLDTKDDRHYFRNFYARRMLRIFPLYFLFVAAMFVLIPRLETRDPGAFVRDSGSPWWYFAFLGNVRESLTGVEPAYVLAPTWSLCIEEQFYLLFPLVVAILSPARLRTLLWSLVLFAPAFRLATALVWPDNERVQYLFTLSRVDTLALGGLLALGLRGHAALPGRTTTNLLLPTALVACGIAFALNGLDRTTPFGRTAGYSLVGLTAFLIALWSVRHRESNLTCWLRCPPLSWLGVVCYGVYLLQRPAEVAVGKLLPSLADPESLTGMGVKCLAAITAGTLSWFLLEKPVLWFQRFFASPRHPGHGTGRMTSVTAAPRPTVENVNAAVPVAPADA